MTPSLPATSKPLDIWWDDDGCWLQKGPQTLGPFQTEEEAEAHA